MRIDKAVLMDFLVPLVLLFALTTLIAATGGDLGLEGSFYLPGPGWVYSDLNPWRGLYRFGVFPAFAVAAGSLVLLVAGFFSVRAYVYRRCALFFLLLMLIGPGLLVNTVLKDHWGRPRPRQMQVFGGDRVFHQVWERGEGGKGMSFPSGHASAAFYLVAPFFVLRRSSRKWAGVALTAGLCYGLLMGVARMVQGGHFPSDVLWAGGSVYLVGVSLYYLLRLDRGVLLPPKV
jgi:membrane-associated PAP2 superfamily phosphatase